MTADFYQIPLRYGDAYDELSADGVSPARIGRTLSSRFARSDPKSWDDDVSCGAAHPRERHHI